MKESVIIQKLIQVGQMLERGQLEYSGAEADTIYLLEQYAALRQPPVISCVCPNEIKTGTVSIHCCNLCAKPDENWWGKH
jgi:hypothetical protein